MYIICINYISKLLRCFILLCILFNRIGRKKAIIIYLLWKGLCGLATAFSTNMTMYIIMRCATATALAGIWDSTSTLCEYMPYRNRNLLDFYRLNNGKSLYHQPPE